MKERRYPSGHWLEVASNTRTDEEIAKLHRIAPEMLEEWPKTKKAACHAARLREKEFKGE